MNIPAFKSHFQVEVFPGEGVLLLSEAGAGALYGRAYELVAPLVDGRRSAGEIVDALAGQLDAATVYYVLALLESKGYLTEAAPEIPAAVAAFWHGMDIEPRTALAVLRDRTVAVLAAGGLDPAGMHSALEAAGLRTGLRESARLWLVLTDDYQREELAAVNQAALQGARPWLLVRAGGPQLWLGPLFIPGETGCWQCLSSRLKRSLRSSSAGKGVSEIQARASALCEAIERYSGELSGGEVRVTCALKDWPPGEAYHPNDIMLYSAGQYARREAWNKRGSRFNRVPEPFTPDPVVDWTPLWSLTEERHKYVPTQLVYYGAPARAGDDTFYAFGCSNGCASGNTLAEAVLQGFFELVERDAAAIWWYNRLPRPGVDLVTFDEPYLLELAEHYRTRYRRETWALDITSDLGIPAFAALSRRLEGPEEQILLGLGCHLDARIALQRAFAEMNQMLGVASSAGKGDRQPLEDRETLTWLREATLTKQPYLAPDPAQPPRRLGDYPKQHSGDFLQDIAYCRQIIEARGMEMLVLDQTRAEVGMPVVKVVVPGLRHFWARFAPGRLYEVPVGMGWLKEPLREEDLNPVPIFF
ncbi:uncharacterized conserved protein [Pelotomaculum thermopropionicum SI]|uniref:Uncharacterized conserved protein n=1 Tax=Pelotomaculum thermopropionicum (strain DSM 13744 / JCM 10971 / SI) TaxID=370438 RepID=A5CZU0_PELTS|nr:uncharacterized conserved protein [Pelotomaculum thermopropionicum SI]